ncbi:uncharacterized protein LOC143349572 [Colletes latitarsis]|uniref:uncharacterized protein LOC143349572 n=1 Tax=Colletes latitarsis TaxID=2605962 RepID=UPI0040363EFC
MSNYSYYYVKTIADDADAARTYKFLKGNPTLFQPPEDTWFTYGRYNLLTRLLRGGLSGSGDIHHPANTVFKVRARSFLNHRCQIQHPSGYCQGCYPVLLSSPRLDAVNVYCTDLLFPNRYTFDQQFSTLQIL